MKRELTPELIRRYLNGDCTPAEATEVREWYDSFENHTDPLAFLSPRERETLKRRMYDEIMLCLQTKGALSDEESSVHAGDDRLPWGGASPRTGNSPLRPVFSRRHLLRFIGGAAAVVLVLLGVRAMFETPVTSETAENCLPAPVSSAQTADTPDPAPEAGMTLVENKMKSIRREILPDGSIVWLKPNTWISFPPTFASSKREVKMEGEAFFEVTPDASSPFVVYSGDLVTRVVGTSFNIKAYRDGTTDEVSVFTGKVSVSLPNRAAGSETGELYLVKDEKAVFVEGKNQLRKQTYSPEIQPELNIWRKNTVSFNNAPVKEVVKVLNEEFNIELKVAETDLELNNYILKADFTNQNLPDILQMLERSLSLTYEIEGKEITLKLDK